MTHTKLLSLVKLIASTSTKTQRRRFSIEPSYRYNMY